MISTLISIIVAYWLYIVSAFGLGSAVALAIRLVSSIVNHTNSIESLEKEVFRLQTRRITIESTMEKLEQLEERMEELAQKTAQESSAIQSTLQEVTDLMRTVTAANIERQRKINRSNLRLPGQGFGPRPFSETTQSSSKEEDTKTNNTLAIVYFASLLNRLAANESFAVKYLSNEELLDKLEKFLVANNFVVEKVDENIQSRVQAVYDILRQENNRITEILSEKPNKWVELYEELDKRDKTIMIDLLHERQNANAGLLPESVQPTLETQDFTK